MTYKVLHGVDLTTKMLNEWAAKGWTLVDTEPRQGLYDVVLASGSGGGGGGGSIKDAETVDSSLEIANKVMGVNINNTDGNVTLTKTASGVSSNLYWKDYTTE